MKADKLPLSLYIHIPFCKKKCLYCDFLSAPACAREREDYVKALLREISAMAKLCTEYRVISVFFGGGTPSLLSAGQMKRMLSAIRKGYNLSEDAEITVECNPATADKKKLSAYLESGINRLSIGLQSANDKELRELGRIHNYCQFLDTFTIAREVGFVNINIDIMSALPGQSYESYMHTLKSVIALQPEHISAYSLIIEEGTPFYERYGEGMCESVQDMECTLAYPLLPDEDTERRMYHDTVTCLQKAGYIRYEISNYAKRGYECCHNMTYWTGIEYLGFGLGAASYFKNCRYKNITSGNQYLYNCKDLSFDMKLSPVLKNDIIISPLTDEVLALTKEDRMEEFMFLGLRLKKGVSVNKFEELFGLPMHAVYGTEIHNLKNAGLLLQNADRLYLSKKGTDVANYVMSHFILGNNG